MGKTKWINQILSGRKTWEIRGTYTKKRRVIQLAESGTGKLVGEARLVDCIGPLSLEELSKYEEKHRIADLSIVKYAHIFAWVLQDATRHAEPKPYKHPMGAITWVRLDVPESEAGGAAAGPVDEECMPLSEVGERPMDEDCLPLSDLAERQ